MSVKIEKLQELHAYCMKFAETMLEEHQEFYPFGALIDTENELRAVGADLGTEYPDVAEQYEFLQKAMQVRAQNKEVLAYAIALNVNVPEQYSSPSRDGVRVLIESENDARYIYTPYSIAENPIEITFMEAFAVEIPPQIFNSE